MAMSVLRLFMAVSTVRYHLLLFGCVIFTSFLPDVHGYCAPGTDKTLQVIKPANNQQVKVPSGSETTLEVRYNGKPLVHWYLNGKRIPMPGKSKHFEFIKGGVSFDQIGPILKVKDFKKTLAGAYKVVIDNAGCINSQTINVAEDTTFSLQRSINKVLMKAPFLKTKVGITLLLLGFAFVFIIIPFMICFALCSKSRKLKKELDSEKGKTEMFHDYEMKKLQKSQRSQKSKSDHKKSSAKERQTLINESSSSDDLPNARPHGKKGKSNK